MAKSAYKCPSCSTALLFEKGSDEQLINCPKCGNRHPAGSFQSIETQRVYCPSCNIGLQVSTAHKGALTCPKCKKSNDIHTFLRQPKSETSRNNDDNLTQIATGKSRSGISGVGRLMLKEGVCTPGCIVLKMGVNTIGRKASTPKSTIQLDTADSYMSKCHANIDVILRGNRQVEHRLSDAGSRNGIWHNGEKLNKEDVVVLQPGDKVRIGRTVFEFNAQ